MIIEIKIPSPGESISEVEIASWLVNDGDFVEKDQEIAEIESDKATLPLMAEESGTISIKAETGTTVAVGSVACTIDTEGVSETKETETAALAANEKAPGETDEKASNKGAERDKNTRKSAKNVTGDSEPESQEDANKYDKVKISPLARRLMDKKGLSVEDVIGGLIRITKEDIEQLPLSGNTGSVPLSGTGEKTRNTGRQRMSMLRRKLSQRLVAVKNETAMLTTFNEVDMSRILEIRKTYQPAFVEKHGVKLGFMSFFAKAVTEALNVYPNVNSFIDGEDIVTPEYCDIGIAVQTDKGLMVPVIRNTEALGLAGIEKEILELAEKARKNRISIEDMTGGTFTITNGGVFGSLLSTPILNPPQSGILGMHNIVERPVAVNGKVEIRPMMYIALSYDHRIIDGRDSVSFLVRVKEMLEDPARLLFKGSDPGKILLEI